ncbi:probable pectate lyase 4 [Spinacia oleracea]|uniref:Pectate lyase n=1 Tax=Spinacia oleracea TaxID=3562 RepID=A0A9R0I2Z2_SPIOL|nr:probable pectate lyase 4 [Spinacia oleracea]
MASKMVYIAILSSFLLAMGPESCLGKRPRLATFNSIDGCWRRNLNWFNNREELAKCSVGFAGKMINNVGEDVKKYVVTDPTDNPTSPKPGTLRYGVTMVPGKVWISFQKDMYIKLERTLLVGSYTTIDGRGAVVHITNGCLLLYQVTNVIIHGLRIHHCRTQPAGPIMGPGAKLMPISQMDGDAIRLLGSTKVWIDHNTLYRSEDGLIDVTLGSTNVTISNNWFRDHDKVMLLGHDDDYNDDKNMKVTVVYNRFGPNCNQRMPRVRHGYAHVANNLYLGWEIYAIGGSMDPSVKSQSNLFVAPKTGSKEIIMSINDKKNGKGLQNFKSVGDVLENGATFKETGSGYVKPNYNKDEKFPVESGNAVRQLTRSAGALRCRGRVC